MQGVLLEVIQMDIDNFLDEHENKDLLRFLTCGSVDDGKSTLIGRLLFDSKLLYDDQISALKKDSEKTGNAGEGEIDYALLLDGLKAEREQGITIDVAYRYFSTPKRKFIIADTPGHEQYTRNMATGASTCDLAIILIDARKGVLTQTKRHAFIVSLLGLKHVVVAVNKMDLVDYSEERFEEIKKEFNEISATLGLQGVTFIPLSALKGENVKDIGDKTPWYSGRSLLQHLEHVDISSDKNFDNFRFPVQYVIRPHLNFRGFAGTVAAGVIKPGDRIKSLPSGKESTVKNLVTADGNLDLAFAGQAIVIELEDEIDISSGEMIVKIDDVPEVSKSFESMLIWMSDKPLDTSRTYYIKQTTRRTKAKVDLVKYAIDVNTFEKNEATKLDLNEIGKVTITTHQPLFFDAYEKLAETGSFVLVDTLTNNTVAAGMITAAVNVEDVPVGSDREVAERHISDREFNWDRGSVTPKIRAARNHHYGKTVIITGAEGSGKKEFAAQLEQQLFNNNLNAYYLGVSAIQEGLDADLAHKLSNRDEQFRRLGELSRIMTDAGLIFITTIHNLDSYELDRLKLLNTPNDFFVISIGSEGKNIAADIKLDEQPNEDAVSQVINLLGDQRIIPDYCI